MASNPPNDHACIYCGDSNSLENEHVVPFGLGGRQVLKRASCRRCATETGRFEHRLLRGQWWPYRKTLGIVTRSRDYPKYQSAKVVLLSGQTRPVQVLSDEVPVVLFFDFDPPSILAGQVRAELPFARHTAVKFIKEGPRRVLEEGVMRHLLPWEKVEYPMNFDSHDVLRFIAKVAHCFAIFQRGPGACTEFFLPSIILGKTEGALTYIGGCSTEVLRPKLPGQDLHAMLDREVDGLLIVNVQVFRDTGDPPPIYEAVVGRVAQ